MEVIYFQNSGWVLLKDNESELYLDVNCSYSAFSYEMLIRLNDTEKLNYLENGLPYIDSLASEVQYHGMTIYKDRNISSVLGSKSYEAIMDWKRNH